MTYPPPIANVLQITIHSARDLVDAEWFGKTTPYVKVTLGKVMKQTVANKGLKPTWEQSFSFAYNNESALNLELWDKDLFKDDYMGVNNLTLLPILLQPDRTYSGDLALTHKKGQAAGFVKVTIQFWPAADAKQVKPVGHVAPPLTVAARQMVAVPQMVAAPQACMTQPQIAPYYAQGASPIAPQAAAPVYYQQPHAATPAPQQVVYATQPQAGYGPPVTYPPPVYTQLQYPPVTQPQQQYAPQGYQPQNYIPPPTYNPYQQHHY